MKRLLLLMLCFGLILLPLSAMAATEQAKQSAIDTGLEWLANGQYADGHWYYNNGDGDLAATASAALAFIEEGYLPGSDVVIGGTNYGDVVGDAANYIFARATVQGIGWETSGYARHAEDYNGNGILDDGGNNQGIYFYSGHHNRDVYTTGIATSVVHSLGEALGRDTTVGYGGVTNSMTYSQVLQDIMDYFSFGQVEPAYGNQRGGWRYYANYSGSDNSTAQWGALPTLYGREWGLDVPQYVEDELELWVNYVQNSSAGTWQEGGSGYNSPTYIVNMAKTGGLLLELAVLGVDRSDSRVQAALDYMDSMVGFDHWNDVYSGYRGDQWYGEHLGNPYAMWAVYKALEVWGIDTISTAPGGFVVGQDWDPQISAAGDWFAQYCDYLVTTQDAAGHWDSGHPYHPWYGALGTGWNINILNAAGAPPPVDPVPEPATMLLLGSGLIGIAGIGRRRQKK